MWMWPKLNPLAQTEQIGKESVLMFSAQCSEYQSEEIQQRAGKRSSYDYLNIIMYADRKDRNRQNDKVDSDAFRPVL